MSIEFNTGTEEEKKPNLSNNFGPIPDNDYQLAVLEANETKSSAGNDMVALKLSVVEGPYKGNHVYDYLVFQDNMKWKTRSFLRALGEVVVDNADIKLEPGSWFGKMVKATCTSEEYNGKMSNKVKAYIDSDGTTAPAKMDQSPPPLDDKSVDVPF